jgi:hypothetical protein
VSREEVSGGGSSDGLTQFPAPPRPVCAYSGGGFWEVRVWTRDEVGWDCDSRSDYMMKDISYIWGYCGERDGERYRLDVVFAVEITRASTADFLVGFCHFHCL